MNKTVEHNIDTDVDPNIEAIERAETLLERAKFAFSRDDMTAGGGYVEDAVACLRTVVGVAA